MSERKGSADVLAEMLAAVTMPVARSRPRRPSTSITPEQVDMVLRVRRVLADLVSGEEGWAELAERLDDLVRECRRQITIEACADKP